MPPMRWHQARSAEAKCLWSSWRGVSDFSTPLCVSARLKLSLARTGAQSDQISPSALQQHAPPRQPSPLFRLPITSFAGHANLDLLASPARSDCFIRVALTGQSGSPEGAMVVVRPSQAAGRKASRGLDRTVISLRRMALGSGYRSWMKSVAVGDRLAATGSRSCVKKGTTPSMCVRSPGVWGLVLYACESAVATGSRRECGVRQLVRRRARSTTSSM
jgi:hypothetical protein